MWSCRPSCILTLCGPFELDKELAHLVVDQTDLVVGHETVRVRERSERDGRVAKGRIGWYGRSATSRRGE